MSDDDRSGEDAHRRLRQSLGGWVLGALDGPDRREVAEHVDHCPECAAEVAALSPLPPLLDLVSEDDLAVPMLASDPEVERRLDAHVGRAEAGVHRRLVRWRAATVAGAVVAAALAVVVGVQSVSGEATDADPVVDRLVAPARPAVAAADGTTGEAATLDWEWGTTVELQLADLPGRPAYVAWVVADDGRREQAGTWGPTSSRGARVYGASSIPRDQVARVEVTSAAGELLLTFGFPGT